MIWCWTTEMKSNIDCTAFDRDSIIFAGNNIGVDKPIAIARHRTWKQFFFALISCLFECLERWKEINYLPPFTTLQVFKSNMSHKLKTLGGYLSPSIWSSLKNVFFFCQCWKYQFPFVQIRRAITSQQILPYIGSLDRDETIFHNMEKEHVWLLKVPTYLCVKLPSHCFHFGDKILPQLFFDLGDFWNSWRFLYFSHVLNCRLVEYFGLVQNFKKIFCQVI